MSCASGSPGRGVSRWAERANEDREIAAPADSWIRKMPEQPLPSHSKVPGEVQIACLRHYFPGIGWNLSWRQPSARTQCYAPITRSADHARQATSLRKQNLGFLLIVKQWRGIHRRVDISLKKLSLGRNHDAGNIERSSQCESESQSPKEEIAFLLEANYCKDPR
jgi:hypothetical protein